MTLYGGPQAFLVVGGKDLRSADTFQLEESIEQIIESSHGIGDSWEESLPVGIGRIMLSAGGGFYDQRAAGIMDAFQAQGATRQLVSYGFSGNIKGAEAVMLDGDYTAIWKRAGKRDGLTRASAAHKISAVYMRGIVIHPLLAETTDPGNTEGTTKSVDNLASSANGVTADLHVTALTLGGFTSLTVKLRHSTDNTTFADVHTYTTVTVAGSSERKTTAGTINRYLAMSWDFVGSGSAESAVPYVVAARG